MMGLLLFAAGAPICLARAVATSAELRANADIVRGASYALKLLQSEGRLSIVTAGRESSTGRTAVERYEVEGPIALLLTTTAANVDEELMNGDKGTFYFYE
ncbi:MAG TPA: hypothetical protein VMM76_12920 [Pirellulaceae bacterium]|nr:hypothetical protein [Pirellulaceae bacterium]